MNSQFTAHHQTALNEMCLVPSVIISLSVQEMKTKSIKIVIKDLPSFDSIEGELHNWKSKWQHQLQTHGQTSLPASPMLRLNHASCSCLQLLCTFPITSCSSERSHSYLKLINTFVRPTRGNTRLSGLTLLSIHHDIPIDVPNVIEHFSPSNHRRLRLANLFFSERVFEFQFFHLN